jgi:dTDP-4-dehydrorhamnose reductase
MKVLISGINGQLGRSVFSSKSKSFQVLGLNKNDFDLQNFDQCKKVINDFKPDWIINTAAYTAVDMAESNRKLAFSINALGVENLAKSVANIGGRLLHISTDFVFDGEKKTPYKAEDICKPINAYGESKLKGEKLSLKYPGTLILRTSWLYSELGRNFCLTMLKLHKKYHSQNIPLKVVSDQKGCPTSCKTLSKICWKFIDPNLPRIPTNEIYHWSDEGIISWFDFSKAIGNLGKKLNLIDNPAEIIPIKSKDFITKAKRPRYSALDCSKTINFLQRKQENWEESLEDVMKSINKRDL